MSEINKHINYIEFKATDLNVIKEFYSELFDWEFTDYGPSYTSFTNSGIQGGFELTKAPIQNGVLVVLYSDELEVIKEKVAQSIGEISKDIFEFPGGRRFEFLDPSGNELAIWSDK
jgi:predicted enzyme related to lactoylglutathione lyase